jgi:hypothetical protein
VGANDHAEKKMVFSRIPGRIEQEDLIMKIECIRGNECKMENKK